MQGGYLEKDGGKGRGRDKRNPPTAFAGIAGETGVFISLEGAASASRRKKATEQTKQSAGTLEQCLRQESAHKMSCKKHSSAVRAR